MGVVYKRFIKKYKDFVNLKNYVFFIFVVKKKSQNIYTFKIMWYNYSEVRYEMSKIKK